MSNNLSWRIVLFGVIPVLTSLANAADINRTIAAVKTATPPRIDGDISDPAWLKASVADKFDDIASDHLAPEQTTARILYDDKNIYVAFDCIDSRPERIEARETVRDSKYQNSGQGGNGTNETEDNVELQLDTFYTRKNTELSRFSVNAIGTPSASLAGGRGNKAEWKGDFIVAVKRVPTGWTAEMQIPWASLNYPGHGPVTMGINFQRYQLRTNVQSQWCDEGMFGLLDREGAWTGLEVPRSAFHPSLSLLPYALGQLGPVGSSARFGLDARYTVTPELTEVATLKPDFSTVEGAIEGIQFSRTERFVPDLRPFFLEGQSYVSDQVKYTNVGSFFYPIRIPTFDLGSNLYGKISPSDTIGLVDAYDFEGRNDLASRFTHNFGPTANAGFYFGDRTMQGDHNEVAAADFHDRWGKLGFEDLVAGTWGTSAGGGASIHNLTYEDKLALGVIQYNDFSANFNDEDGFFPNVGYKGFTGVGGWFNTWQHGPWRDFMLISVPQYWWHTDGRVFQRGMDTSFAIDTRTDWDFSGEYNYFRFDDQIDNTVTLGFTSGVTNRFRQWGVSLQMGSLANHPASFLMPKVSLRVFKKLDLAYSGSVLNLQGVTQQHIVTANYELSPTQAFGGRLVTQNSNTNWFLYYHNSGGKGTETYLLVGDPNALKFTRKVELKVIFALGSKHA